MSDADALLNAIAAHPDEDTPRLMYADWLDEHGQPDRAEFIRVQIEIARKEHLPRAELNRYVPLYERNQELIDNHRAELLGPLAALPTDARIEYRRGFVAEVTMSWGSAFDANEADPNFYTKHFLSHSIPVLRLVLTVSIDEARRFLTHHRKGVLSGEEYCVTGLHTSSVDRGHFPPTDIEWWMSTNSSGWAQQLPRLEELFIPEGRLGDANAADLLHSRAFPVLTELDLSHNDLTDAAVESLLDSGLPRQLKRLILGGNSITDAGALALAERWPTGAGDRLEHLNLRFTQIGQVGQAALLRRFGGRIDLF